MHELSLMQSVMDMVKDSATQNGIQRVGKVKLVVGRFSMAMPDSLRFAFEVLTSAEPMFQGAALEIENRAIVCQCRQCGLQKEIEEDYRFVCAGCGSTQVDIIQGQELYLDYYEGDND